jgi:hypothetical protein
MLSRSGKSTIPQYSQFNQTAKPFNKKALSN